MNLNKLTNFIAKLNLNRVGSLVATLLLLTLCVGNAWASSNKT